MTDTSYRATPEQWQYQEQWAKHPHEPDENAACLLELRARVEHLEAMRETEKAALLDIYEYMNWLKSGHELNWSRIVKLEDGAACPHIVTSDEGTSYCRLAESVANSQPTPNSSQISSSLVERVARAISLDSWDVDPSSWTAEAYAAIREVAAWMRENECDYNAVRWLEQEAER